MIAVVRIQAKEAHGITGLAERARFELANGFPLPLFESGAFSHSATFPHITQYRPAVRRLASITFLNRGVNPVLCFAVWPGNVEISSSRTLSR